MSRRFRNFGGKRFTLYGDCKTKQEAKDLADALRAHGLMARVVPAATHIITPHPVRSRGMVRISRRATAVIYPWSVYGRRK